MGIRRDPKGSLMRKTTKSISITEGLRNRMRQRKTRTGETFDDIVRQACADIVGDDTGNPGQRK